MSLRVIAKLLGQRRDRGHDPAEQLLSALDRISRAVEKDGGQPMNMRAVRQIAQKTLGRPHAELTEHAMAHYVDALSEPERAMFEMCRDGMTASKIAKRMGMERHTVARSLAKIYADLKRSNRHNQPTKEAYLG